MAGAAIEAHNALMTAKGHYLDGRYDEALRIDDTLHEHADPRIRALALRGSGLCHYRLGDYRSSEVHLRKAQALASAFEDPVLHCRLDDHLANTLRRLGRPDQSLDLLTHALRATEALDLADHRCLAVRARLLASIGSLYEEFGRSPEADDQFARVEELTQIIKFDPQLRNARAHSGGTALRRGDFDGAIRRYQDELRLAGSHPAFRAQALHHLGSAHAAAGSSVEAEARFEEALQVCDDHDTGHRAVSARVAYARFLRQQARYVEAFRRLDEAQPLADSLEIAALRATLREELAQTCHDVGLHGEAMWHLEQAVTILDGLRAEMSKEVRELSAPRWERLEALVRRLVIEAATVPRTGTDVERLSDLVHRVSGKPLDQFPHTKTDLGWDWQRRQQEAGRTIWDRLLEGDLERLDDATARDLVRSEIAYHGAVDDLGRSVHLLAVAVERLLRERLLVPLASFIPKRDAPEDESRKHLEFRLREPDRVSLGDLIEIAVRLGGTPIETLGPAWRPLATRLEDQRPHIAPLAALRVGLTSLAGTSRQLPQMRNDVAHGRADDGIDRLMVDAVKRHLTLTPGPPLRALANLRLAL